VELIFKKQNMSINIKHFQQFIVQPTLQIIGINSKGFEQLIICTAITESNLEFLQQHNNGPAKGLFQMEDATHDDIWNNFLKYKPDLAKKITAFLLPNTIKNQQIYGNLYYATAMCAAHYLRFLKTMPEADNLAMLAKIWKSFYNTKLGKGTEQNFILKAKLIIQILK
jgi:hypothetical protein